MKIFGLIIYTTFAILTAPLQAATNPEHIEKIDALMIESHNRGLFNGNVLVSQNGKVLYQNEMGYTNGDKKHKLAKSSRYALGSITKEFSAVGIMMLQQQGLLDINDPLSKYAFNLPSWSRDIQIKHLLNYTSGLPKLNFRKIKKASDINGQLKAIESLRFPPGKGYLYSNHNVFLQIELIEKLTHKSYADFVEDNFFKPLNMNDSSLAPASEANYLVSSFNNEGINDFFPEFPVASMVYSTTADMLKWQIALHSEKLISKSSLKTLFNAFSANANSALGDGRYDNDKLSFHRHHGSHFNFESQIYHNTQLGLSVILLTNNKNFKLSSITNAVESIVQGKSFNFPKKSLYLTIRQTAYENANNGIKLYYSLKQSAPNLYDFENNNALIRVGYKLIEQKQFISAIEIFTLSTKEFPKHANAFDSLAEAFFANGQMKLALKNYKISVALNVNNSNGHKMIEKIKKDYL